MLTFVQKPTHSLLVSLKSVPEAVFATFEMFSAASAVANALDCRRQPAVEDLRKLGIENARFNLNY